MAKDDLIQLPRFSYTSLDFETIIDDIKRIITENPEYNQNWDDFLSSNAGKMIIELVAYIVDLLSFRVDWMSNELYIGTATQKQSIINLLKLINYRLTLPQAAVAKVDVTLSNWVEPFDLPLRMSLTGTDRNGDAINFELLKLDENGQPYYFGLDALVTLDPGSPSNPKLSFSGNDALLFYEGTTKFQEETMKGGDNETVIINEYPVIENSIQIWTLDGNGNEVEKLPMVTSFVSEEAQQKQDGSPLLVPPYMIEVDENSQVTLKFPSSSLAKTFDAGDEIRIYYRVGGGSNGNIVIGAINTSKGYVVEGIPVTVSFKNNEAGAGGTEMEDVFEARKRAPLYLTTADKTVSPLDYKRILLEHPNVLMAAAYGKANEPPEIKDEYGYTIPTYETWIYIVPNKNWTSYDPRTEYNLYLQPSKPYEIKTINLSFPDQTILTGTIDFTSSDTRVTGHNTLFAQELDTDDIIVLTGSGTGDETYVGIVDHVESGSNEILYLKNPPSFSGTNQTFGISSLKIKIPSQFTPVYQAFSAIDVQSTSGQKFIQGVDYTFDYQEGVITRWRPYAGYGIPANTDLIITWWWQDQTHIEVSDINTLEEYLKNKKMLCINNVYMDTLYTAFDIAGTVYVEKNYNQDLIKTMVDEIVSNEYSLPNRDYAKPIQIAEIISLVQTIPGVRYIQITYFGKDYGVYKQNPSNPPSYARNYGLGTIPAKYNEILVLSNNEYEGNTQSIDHQLHGIIFDYQEVVE